MSSAIPLAKSEPQADGAWHSTPPTPQTTPEPPSQQQLPLPSFKMWETVLDLQILVLQLSQRVQELEERLSRENADNTVWTPNMSMFDHSLWTLEEIAAPNLGDNETFDEWHNNREWEELVSSVIGGTGADAI